MYLLTTVLRSVRADFAPQIWAGLKADVPASTFAGSETAVAACVLVLVGASLVALDADVLSPFAFMVLHGIGMYLPYIVIHTTIFERLIAMTRDRCNVGYLLYLADSFGYLGYVGVLLARNAFGPAENFLGFFRTLSWVVVAACLLLLLPCGYYFARHPAAKRSP